MKIVYIAHPIGGNVEKNIVQIKAIYRHLTLLVNSKVIPFAPYLEGFNFLKDTCKEHRELGIRNNKAFFDKKAFDELWLYGDKVSLGMSHEIEWAEENNIPVVGKTQGTREWIKERIKSKKMKNDFKYIDIALRVNGISIPEKELKQIVDTVNLVNKKGGKATIKDLSKI